MQTNLMDKDVENKRLSTTSVSLSVATSVSPSLLSETSNANSILSKSPTPSSFSNYSNNGTKLDDKKKLKKVFHKFLNKTKLFNGSHSHSHSHSSHSKKSSYSQSLNDENGIYENNVYGYPTPNSGKDITNTNANLNKNANTVSTSQPLLYVDSKNSSNHSTITNNYLTTPNNGSLSQIQLPKQLKDGNESLKSLSMYSSVKDLEEKLQNETEKNMCSEDFTAKEFAAEVGITIFEEDEDADYYTNNTHSHYPSCSTCGMQGTYCSSKSYGPRLDMSIFEPPTEKVYDSNKTLNSKYNVEKSSETLSSQHKISLEAMFDNKEPSNESIEIVDLENVSKRDSNQKEEMNKKLLPKPNDETNLPSIPARKYKGKKLSRFEVEVLSGNLPKSVTYKPTINTNLSMNNMNNSCHSATRANSTPVNFNLNATYSLPNLTDLNKLSRNGNGYHTTPSSPARRDYGVALNSERNDNVYFNVGGSSYINNQTRKPRRVSISKHPQVLDDSKINKLKIIVDSADEKDQNNPPSSASTTSSSSPIHFEVNHPTSSSSSLDIYNLNNNENISSRSTAPSRDMTTTIITPEINDTTVDNDSNSTNTSNTITSSNTPSAEELKKIWIDRTLGGNTNHVNKYHITNFQTEISKADKTIHTTTTSKIKDCMTNTESVVFPIQIIKTPVSSKCNTCLKESNQMENTKINVKSSLAESTSINKLVTGNEKSEDRSCKNDEKSEDGSNVVQVIQKGRFTVMKEHHDYKHAVPHHYKFVIIRNPSTNTLIPQKSSEDVSTSSLSSSNSVIDATKIGGLNVNQDHKETLSTIITPTTSSELTTDQMNALVPPLNASPSDSPVVSRSPTLSTISIPHQQLANIAAASLSSNLNLSEGIAYTTTINTDCSKCNELNKNEEHVFIVPTNDEKRNNLTCIQSFTSSTTPISSSLYISTSTLGPLESTLANDLNTKQRNGLTVAPIAIKSSPTLSTSPSGDLSTTPKPILFNKCCSSTSTYRSISNTNVEKQDIQQEPKLEPSHIVSTSEPNITKDLSSSHIVSTSEPNITKDLSSTSTYFDNENNDLDNASHSIIPNSTINKSASVASVNCESKPPLSPTIYPTLNSTVTLVNNSQSINSINNQNSILSEDLSLYTTYSDDTFIHNENDINNAKPNSRLCEEINNKNNSCMPFIQHSETELHRDYNKKNEFKDNLRKTQSVQYPEQIKPYNYSYDSLDRESSVNVLEPLEIDEDNDLPLEKMYRPSPGHIEISQGKMDREVVTSPYFVKELINKKKYFPTNSCDQVVHPPEYERKDSYYDYDPSEQHIVPNMERKYSEISLDPSIHSQNYNGFERSRAYSMSSMNTTSECSSKYNPMGSSITGKDSIKTTSTTTTEYPVHPHHHHHFFVISNSEADIPTTSQLKHSNDYVKENSSTRVVISSRQHRKFDITTSSTSSKASLLSQKPINSNSTTNLLHHRRTPSNSSTVSTHSSRFIITREQSSSKNVNINDKSPLSSATSITPKKQSRFTVTRQAIN